MDSILVTGVTFFIILSILVFIHELGHFLAAVWAGVWVEEFCFGLPPRLYGKKIGETIYSINALPIGGFVRLHGENDEETIIDPKRAFLKKSRKVRSVIVLAGVFMNFLLGIFAFSSVYTYTGIPTLTQTGKVEVIGVMEGSPAESAKLEVGDVVKTIDGSGVSTVSEFIETVDSKNGKEVLLGIERGEENLDIKVTPRVDPPEGEGALGISISSTSVTYTFPPIWQRPFLGIYHGFQDAIFWGGLILSGLGSMVQNLFSGVIPKDVAGPAGLLALTSEVSKQGIIPLINWMGIISINLAILNVVPFPALDGGRLLFIGIEGIFGRRIVPRVESWIHAAGLALLVLLLLAVTIREVRMIIQLGFSGYVQFLQQQGM